MQEWADYCSFGSKKESSIFDNVCIVFGTTMSQVSETGSRLSSLQLELLKVYALEPTPEEMEDVRRLLGQYFGRKLAEKVGAQAKQKGMTERDLDQWLNEEA